MEKSEKCEKSHTKLEKYVKFGLYSDILEKNKQRI